MNRDCSQQNAVESSPNCLQVKATTSMKCSLQLYIILDKLLVKAKQLENSSKLNVTYCSWNIILLYNLFQNEDPSCVVALFTGMCVCCTIASSLYVVLSLQLRRRLPRVMLLVSQL